MKPLKKQVTFPIRIKRALSDFKRDNQGYSEFDLFAHAFELGVNKGKVLKGEGITEALRDQSRYKTLIQSASYMPSVLGLWTINDHKRVFKNNQTTYPKKLMDTAVDSVIALNSRKKKNE